MQIVALISQYEYQNMCNIVSYIRLVKVKQLFLIFSPSFWTPDLQTFLSESKLNTSFDMLAAIFRL